MTEITTWEKVHILGRTIEKSGVLNFVWTGSGVEFEMNASELAIVLETGTHLYMPWISLVLGGDWIAHIPVQEGENKLTLFKGMDPNVNHRVRIVKDFQASVDDPSSYLYLKKILVSGEINKPAPCKYNIEFIGDSITSGEGALGAHEEMDWITPYFSSVRNYAYMIADDLHADYRSISQSGWGIVNGWDNNIFTTLPSIYHSTEAKRNVSDYDHSSWKADAVVINLGTNDEYSFQNPAFTDPATGKKYQNKNLPGGEHDPEALKRIEKGIIDFIKDVRKSNPQAHILWVYGMLGFGLGDTIENALSSYISESGDKNAAFLKLPDTTEDAFGSRGHPGEKSHRAAADAIVDYLKNVL
jgi:hypothetical protein